MPSAVIVDVVRTGSGKGKPGGILSRRHPAVLLADTLVALLDRNDFDPALVDDVIAGCVTQSGEQAHNIGRTALLAAGLPESVPATTIDRQCGSGQQALHFAAQGIMAGVHDVVIACGVESMSRVPMFSNAQGQDANVGPLVYRYPQGLVPQGISAELIAADYGLGRTTLDEFAARSHRLAAAAADAGAFANEIVPVRDDDPGRPVVDKDETIRPNTTVEKLAELRPAFHDVGYARRFPEITWSVTAGNSSPLTDGASAALIMSERMAADLGLRARARFHTFSAVGSDPLRMLTGPIPATERVLKRGGLSIDDIDTFEVNEAFASVPLAWLHHFAADPDRLNPRGGAIALGHPLGASGVRILATMLNHLESTSGRYGLQTMCEGGGMANAMIIEKL
ncbi:thiolase family protein [Dactylosporangium sp. AC04546]|uniref:thiolase family protein n=1 Tax=Dactylosporangium sp. AC04546 TaxID=2862460 RepID=UPI001EE094DB|nr:thiolase family protein [Dactylosporangium sp. AC04546]WVK86962.1 thiolase family protein [Dactylosporangium sp. AC04546]